MINGKSAPDAVDRALRIPRRRLAILVALGIAQAIALVALVLLLRMILLDLEGQRVELSTTLLAIGALAAILFANAVLRGIEFTLAEKMGYELIRALRTTMYEHLSRMSPRQIQHRSRGSLLLRFTGDVTMLRTWISRGVARGIVSLITLVAGTTVLAVLDPWMALALLAVLFAGAAMSLLAGERLRRTTRWVRRKRGLLTSNVDEQIGALATVQAFGRSHGEIDRMTRQNDSLTATLLKEARIRGTLRAVSSGTAWLSTIPLLIVGAIEVNSGRASLATVITAATASRFLIGTVRDLGLSHDYWQRARISRRKIDDFLASRSMRPDVPGHDVLRARRGRIELQNVAFDGSLRGVTATVEPGQVIAIVGPSGSGKSTLLQLIGRLADPDGGRILVDGQDLATCTRSSSRRRISIASPDLPLMRGSLRRNLTYRVPDVSEIEVSRTVAVWHLHEMFGQFPGGLDGWLTERGANLSAGQRQRLALARAFIDNPLILLLDEPTVHLDAFGREIFRRLVTRHGGTALIVTHEPEEAALADVVWMMADGRIDRVLTGRDYAASVRRRRSATTSGLLA